MGQEGGRPPRAPTQAAIPLGNVPACRERRATQRSADTLGCSPASRKDPNASIALPGLAWWGLWPGFFPIPTSHLRAAAALSAVGIGAALCFELSSPNWLRGPVQALTTRSPQPRLLEEKPSQGCVVGKAAAKSHSNKEVICLFLDTLSTDNERGAGKSACDNVQCTNKAAIELVNESTRTGSLTDKTDQGERMKKGTPCDPRAPSKPGNTSNGSEDGVHTMSSSE